jgi:hypothetical protein
MRKVIQWLGGEHEFALDIGGLRALQTACNAGPEQILADLSGRSWKIDHTFQTIRLGLIGGGMKADEAARIVDTAFRSHPLMLFKPTAHLIILCALMGDPDDPLGDASGEARGETAPPENGGSASSTGPAQP